MRNFGKRLLNGVSFGIKIALLVSAIATVVVFLGAPSLFGIVFITGAAVTTVVLWTAGSFLVSTLFGAMFTRRGLVDAGPNPV